MSQSFLRLIAENLFCEPAEWETQDIYKRLEECENKDITKCVVKEMMCEHTGTHFLDSGGHLGRAFERNKTIKDKDWDKIRPRISIIDVSEDYFHITKDLYHFLVEHLEYDQELDKQFHKFAETNSRSWLQDMEDFGEEILDYQTRTMNSYGRQTLLGGTIQYAWVGDLYDPQCIILQTHNGCDVRGGYSSPHAFQSPEPSMFHINQTDLHAECPNCDVKDFDKTFQLNLDGDIIPDAEHVNAYTDDGGAHWYDDCGGSEFHLIPEDDVILCPKCGYEINFW